MLTEFMAMSFPFFLASNFSKSKLTDFRNILKSHLDGRVAIVRG